MGADRETYLAQQIERATLTDFDLFEENVRVFKLFQEIETQFRYVAGGQKLIPTGLDYTGVMTHLNCLYPKEEIPDLFKELQIIERAYIRARHG